MIDLNLKLRNFEENDIEKFKYWFTIETEWMNWDAPWEWIDYEFDGAEQLSHRLQKTKNNPCFECEIIYNNEHIGWVSAYYMTDDYKYNDLNKTNKIAIGIDIPNINHRKLGIGKEVYRRYLEYFKSLGYNEIYTQTWSGNIPMIKMALNSGFKEINRYKDLRIVNNQKFDALTFKIEI